MEVAMTVCVMIVMPMIMAVSVILVGMAIHCGLFYRI
jgi:hypothetical protein